MKKKAIIGAIAALTIAMVASVSFPRVARATNPADTPVCSSVFTYGNKHLVVFTWCSDGSQTLEELQ